MNPEQQLRNLRDFLLVYNRMTEVCFQRCSSNFNYRNLTMDEERCVDNCAGKLIRSNHRLMGTYVQLMPKMVQRRVEEMESKASQSTIAVEPAVSADVAPPSAEGAVGSQSPITSSPPAQELTALTPSMDDARPEAFGSLLTPAGSDSPLDVNHHVSNSTITSEVKLPAATALPNVTMAAHPSELNAGSGPSYGTSSTQSLITDAQIELERSVPVLRPSKPASISENMPTIASTMSAREKAAELRPKSSQD